ncbi:PspC domain-containing protein [Paenibacillus sp. J5C_2022]|uniref:PspC domain-containing protein n=1 Tax=Paenibacillus sp. J5C2022 TaxID=2977129 RepID=UPI0021CFCA3F|nr:PspC domain-containing protein [Paenibacillus sp. J5C2022]MCU6712500.1 PspC domain-containing protein [Paenibacillus sp. J5C2022]
MRKLFRSKTDSKITGLCGGIAEYFNIDATIVRLIVAISALFSFGTTVLVYFIATLFIPKAAYPEQPPYMGHHPY